MARRSRLTDRPLGAAHDEEGPAALDDVSVGERRAIDATSVDPDPVLGAGVLDLPVVPGAGEARVDLRGPAIGKVDAQAPGTPIDGATLAAADLDLGQALQGETHRDRGQILAVERHRERPARIAGLRASLLGTDGVGRPHHGRT
jgi:hypothetical protein